MEENSFKTTVTFNSDSKTLSQISQINRERAKEWHKGGVPWIVSDWSNAMAGEAGEVCNEVKKLRRIQTGVAEGSEEDVKERIGNEIADTLAYLDLLADHLGLSLEEVFVKKFNEVSEREGFKQRL